MIEKETITDLKQGMSDSEYEAYYKGYNKGYAEGLEYYRELTFKDHYEKLCEEIRESVIKEILNKIESYYQQKGGYRHEQTTK